MDYFKSLSADTQRYVNSVARGEDRFRIQEIINQAYADGQAAPTTSEREAEVEVTEKEIEADTEARNKTDTRFDLEND